MPSILDPAEILQMHKQYADEFAQLAQSGLTGAFSALSQSGLFDYNPALVSIKFPTFGQPKSVGTLPVLPTLPTIPDAPDLKDFVDIPNPHFPTAPNDSLGSVPGFFAPVKPATGTPDFNVTPPTIPAAPTMPDVPAYLALPSLILPYPTVDVPTAPTLVTPVFEGQRPQDITMPDADVLVDHFRTEQNDHRNLLPAYAKANADAWLADKVPEYASIRAQINGILLNYTNEVSGGGAGIPENVERGILSRAQAKAADAMVSAINTAATNIGKKGFTIPGGALLAVVKQGALAAGSTEADAAVQLATKNLELEQNNFQFMLKIGADLQAKVLDVFTSWMQLSVQMDANAISAAKEIVATYLGAYNLQVMVYKAMWDGYTADAEVLKARIAALNSQVQLYEAEIRAELAKTEINKAQVAVLQAVADVNRSLADTYKAQVDAATATLEVARLQTSIFEMRVRAYASQVGAYEARWNAYRAEVDGELAKFRGYEAQANSLTARVTAYRAQVDAAVAQIDGLAKINEAVGQRNDATIKVYSTQADIAIKNFDAQVAGYTAESNAIVQQAQIEVEYWRANANLIFQEFNAALNQTFEYAREQMNLFRAQMEAAISAANGLAQASNVAGNLAGGAMTGLTSFAGTLVSSQQ